MARIINASGLKVQDTGLRVKIGPHHRAEMYRRRVRGKTCQAIADALCSGMEPSGGGRRLLPVQYGQTGVQAHFKTEVGREGLRAARSELWGQIEDHPLAYPGQWLAILGRTIEKLELELEVKDANVPATGRAITAAVLAAGRLVAELRPQRSSHVFHHTTTPEERQEALTRLAQGIRECERAGTLPPRVQRALEGGATGDSDDGTPADPLEADPVAPLSSGSTDTT